MQRTPGQQMPVRMRRAIVTNIRQARDRLEAAQSVAAVDDMSGEEESGDILGRPHSAVQTSLRRLHVNLDHPKNNVLICHPRHAHATQQTLEAERLRMPCLRSCQIPSSRTTVLFGRSQTSSQKHCDGCEGTAGWIPGEWMKTLHVVCEGCDSFRRQRHRKLSDAAKTV